MARAWLLAAPALHLPACFGEISDDKVFEAPSGEVSGSEASSGDAGTPDGMSPVFVGEIPPASACAADEADPGPELTRRLTVQEYVRTVEDTLGVHVDASALPPDSKADGFANTASALTVTFSHVQSYFDLAAQIVTAIPDFSALVGRHATCRDMRSPCQDSYIESLGNLLYRRPLDGAEVDRVRPVFAQVAADGGDFDEAARDVLRRLLQSPQFLYRLEAVGPAPEGAARRTLSDHELANRLSYLVWGSSPDPALWVAADSGDLRTGAGRAAEVERMLRGDRAHDQLETYIRDWLYLDRLQRIERTRQRYPEFTPALAEDMLEETVRLADTLWLSEAAPMAALFTSERTFASPALAEVYGLPSQGAGFQAYDTAPLEARAGALTHPGVLALSGLGETPSIVARGLYVLQNLLCGEIGNPPPGVDTTPVDSAPGRSQRYYSEQRLENRSCAGCHGQFDPLAYALEPFDGIGRLGDEDEHGNHLRSDGWFFSLDGEMTPYDDTPEFLALLAGSQGFRQCLVKKTLQYALGRPLLESDRCMLAEVWEEVETGNGTYGETLIAIARHPAFAMVRAEEAL